MIPTQRRHRPANPLPKAVFASVAIPFNALPAAAGWRRVHAAVDKAAFSPCGGDERCSERLPWHVRLITEGVAAARAASFHAKLALVNRTVNRGLAYASDARTYGTLDYWAGPARSLSEGQGDCEDFAILKMAALKAAGVPMASMSLVVLRDRKRNLFHAVLAVSTSQGHFILDNLSDRVRMDTELPQYQPLYSVSATRVWIHGTERGSDLMASSTGLPSTLAPGVGYVSDSGPQRRGRYRGHSRPVSAY